MKHWRVAMAFVAAASLAGGCQTGDDSQRLLIDPLTAQDLGYSVQWSRNLGLPAGTELIYAELLGGRLVTLEDQNVVTVIDVSNGDIIWRHQVAQAHEQLSRPRREGQRLVLSSQTRAYVRDFNTGAMLGIIPLEHASLGTPVVTGGRMIHGSPNALLFAQDLNDGLVDWASRVDIGIAAPLVHDAQRNLLIATDLDGNIRAFDPQDGERYWTRRLAEPVRARPAIGPQFIYAASTDQSLYALRIQDGQERWRHYGTAPLRTSPFLANNLLIQEVPDDAVVSLDPNTGEERWRNPQLLGGEPVQLLEARTLYVHLDEELLHVDATNGEILDRTPLPDVDTVLTQTPTGGDLYLVQARGRILKISPR